MIYPSSKLLQSRFIWKYHICFQIYTSGSIIISFELLHIFNSVDVNLKAFFDLYFEAAINTKCFWVLKSCKPIVINFVFEIRSTLKTNKLYISYFGFTFLMGENAA